MHTKAQIRESGPPPTASDLLNAAADWINSHGWIQGNFYEQGTLAACAVGALHFAAREVFGRDTAAAHAAIADATDALADIAAEWNGKPIDAPTAREQLIEWNNTGCIDQADAVVWMQKATAHLQEQGR